MDNNERAEVVRFRFVERTGILEMSIRYMGRYYDTLKAAARAMLARAGCDEEEEDDDEKTMGGFRWRQARTARLQESTEGMFRCEPIKMLKVVSIKPYRFTEAGLEIMVSPEPIPMEHVFPQSVRTCERVNLGLVAAGAGHIQRKAFREMGDVSIWLATTVYNTVLVRAISHEDLAFVVRTLPQRVPPASAVAEYEAEIKARKRSRKGGTRMSTTDRDQHVNVKVGEASDVA